MQSDKYYIFCICIITSQKLQQFNRVVAIMGIYINDKKLVMITSPKPICFNLLIIDSYLKA